MDRIEQAVVFVDKVVDACTAVIREQDSARPLPERLYHFTDVQGFQAILTTQSLWSSLGTALNDAEEVRHGIGMAKAIADEAASSSLYYRTLLECLETPKPLVAGGVAETRVFITSFCGRCDKASQWLHYGRGGRGVAVGFSQQLGQLLGREATRLDYDLASQTRWLQKFMAAGEQVATSQGGHRAFVEVAAQIVATYLPVSAARLKHPSFADEEESRVIGVDLRIGGKAMTSSHNEGALKWRSSGGSLIPYEELSFQANKDVIEEVVVGYSSPLGLDSASLCVSEHLGSGPIVRRSEVPVRGTI